LLFCALVLATIFIWKAALAQGPHNLTFAVLNIGQGDALYIESPSGVQVLLDGGPDSSVLRELPKVMPVGDRSLDALIESHPDADHIGGFSDVISRYEGGAFIEPGIPKNTATAKNLEKKIDGEHIPRTIARAGMELDLGDGVFLHILYPDHDVSNLPDAKANEGGIVARLVYGSFSVLLMADIPSTIEDHLVAVDGEELHSDILKVGHHGSRTSTDANFIEDVQPSLAVISVGANNRYGHPTPETLARLKAANVPVLRTDKDGTLVFHSDGETFWRAR